MRSVFVHEWGVETGSKFEVYICHGAAEHGGRYGELASVFVSMGGRVFAPDHQGHGRTAEMQQLPLGWTQDDDAIDGMARDVADLIKERNTLPWVLMGHSMGTVIAQYCLEKLKNERDLMRNFRGLVLSGPPTPPSAVEILAFKSLLRIMKTVNKGQGIIQSLTLAKYDKQIRLVTGNKSLPKNSWLNEDPVKVQEYNDDRFCGHDLNFNVWQSLLYHLEKLPSLSFSFRAPILILGGDSDPATHFGKNLDLVRDRLKRHVRSLLFEQILFPGARHELTHSPIKHFLFDKLRLWTASCLDL